MYDVIWSNWQTQKAQKQKLWIKREAFTECFENSPAESSDASVTPSLQLCSQHCPTSPFSPHSLPPTPLLCLLLSVSFSLSATLETKCLKRKERTPFLLISRGLSRRRIRCLSISSTVHGLSTVLWSWACVAKEWKKGNAYKCLSGDPEQASSGGWAQNGGQSLVFNIWG